MSESERSPDSEPPEKFDKGDPDTADDQDRSLTDEERAIRALEAGVVALQRIDVNLSTLVQRFTVDKHERAKDGTITTSQVGLADLLAFFVARTQDVDRQMQAQAAASMLDINPRGPRRG